MKLEIRGHHLEVTPSLRTYVEEKLDPILRHHAGLIEELQVRLADTTGPHKKSGVDMSCRITARLRFHVAVHVEEVGEDMHAAILLASDRALRAIQKQIDRARDPPSP